MNEEPIDPALQELMDAFNNGLIDPVKELVREYRLYYDDLGNIVQVSDSNWNHPESGNYVIVDKNIHNNWNSYYIRNRQAVLKITNASSLVQLVKSNAGYKVVKNHPALIVEDTDTIKDIEYYDYRNC